MATIEAGLVGSNISGSLSPVLHEKEGAAHRLFYSYQRLDSTAGPYAGASIRDLLLIAEDAGMVGINITHPFKRHAVPFMDELSPVAEQLGAINTVKFQDGLKIGFNTDYSGFKHSIESKLSVSDRGRVLVVGAGGAGAAVALALLDTGTTQVGIVDKDRSAAEALSAQLTHLRSSREVSVVDGHDAKDWTGIVNCTPVGSLHLPGMAIDPMTVDGLKWVNDIVYTPLHTELLLRTLHHGLQAITGIGMVVGQAADSFRLFTGLSPDSDRMSRYIHAHLNQPPNRTTSRGREWPFLLEGKCP